MKKRNREPCWQFSFYRLISLFLQVFYLSDILIFKYEVGSQNLSFVASVVFVCLILTVTKYTIIEPSEAGNLILIVKELQFDRV